MYKTYIAADQYLAKKAKMEEHGVLGIMGELKPVDLNYGYVAFNTSQKDKESSANLEASSECNLDRFGLTEAGVQKVR